MSRPVLDLDLLRTLVIGVESGSFAGASARIGRTQSAVSLQMKKLEDALGVGLFEKRGRLLALTPAGERLYDYAQRLLQLQDEAVEAVRGEGLSGQVRFGMSVDFENTWLPEMLARFSRSHPGVSIEVVMDRNSALAAQARRGAVDIALVFGPPGHENAERLARAGMIWIGRPGFSLREGEPLPLLLLERPCIFHEAAVAALDAAGIRWRLAVTSPTQGGLWAAARAGIGVTVRTEISMPPDLVNLARAQRLPRLPGAELSLLRSGKRQGPALQRLEQTVIEVMKERLGSSRMSVDTTPGVAA
ncbi:LysR substrate-binding domain-containing protein [Noviherbaspirillum aridicola]|uniref:LysR family transcriptional regulator n=1 Tax=Noviherbaspirillum aridicola TaxID=2849687 RepID=A0ABQ4Q8W0_9BURK|nr:LysR substrate-binding domain-containing protein [Noviherbaspirillum aridicola]GIZ53652.1 LysR family transcriptional regulator [Noviherbaspirillum aridicola]